MGASDRFSGMIPKEKVGGAAQWELRPLAAGTRAPGPVALSARGPNGAREQSGYEAGQAQGYADAMRAAQQARGADLQRLEGLLLDLRGRFDELSSRTADALLDLALDVAAQVLRREVQTRRDAALPVVREALQLVIDAHAHPTVRLAPQDFALVREALQADGRFHGCRFLEDDAIAPGGCRIESPQGEIDATLATRWRRVVQSLGAANPLPDAAPDQGAAAGAADSAP